jgi:GGDEF domain-containing protein
LLKAVAVALKESCRRHDYVARMCGDEFVVLAPEIRRTGLEDNIRR